jgi:hypothetical protein
MPLTQSLLEAVDGVDKAYLTGLLRRPVGTRVVGPAACVASWPRPVAADLAVAADGAGHAARGAAAAADVHSSRCDVM